MVKGLDKFKEYFKEFKGKYVLIGGAACDLWIEGEGLTARATKDLDIILVVESLDDSFSAALWKFIIDGKYKNKQKNSDKKVFYRFNEPGEEGYPHQLELLSKAPDGIKLPEDAVFTKVPVGEGLSSLSAILLDEDYYDFVRGDISEKEEIILASVPVLICLKAKAYLNLKAEKVNDDNIRSSDIKKHKSDVIRLLMIIEGGKKMDIPNSIKKDLKLYLEDIEQENDTYFTSILSGMGAGGRAEKTSIIDILKKFIG